MDYSLGMAGAKYDKWIGVGKLYNHHHHHHNLLLTQGTEYLFSSGDEHELIPPCLQSDIKRLSVIALTGKLPIKKYLDVIDYHI